MSEQVSYAAQDGVAVITMDDGKVNALSPELLAAVDLALTRAVDEGLAVLLCGRDGVFSAGFDLPTLIGGGPRAHTMLTAGFRLAERMLALPVPTVVACGGHALAMGAFLLLAADHRVGAAGDHRIAANEVAIGLTVPAAGVELCRRRLTPAHFQRAVVNAEVHDPEAAVRAGFLDEVVPPEALRATATAVARRLAGLDRRAHAATKLRARSETLAALRRAIDDDAADFHLLFGS
ncbi:crotonase/enoyl-CoA hydratase family protein [Thermomonospora umbrina]|uniref:Enoyl-CoA hydratase n=1 Tax=Thermomonospora umbrina TaxID=111806 RepID=A0A3D9SLV0_9ACTN|nr:crotonase/enoyl-CoA hydratase family protein [Thermomonospora umbrina]REE96828.1 enoyl-CoA hydratase [Thermomonospora umbrina]